MHFNLSIQKTTVGLSSESPVDGHLGGFRLGILTKSGDCGHSCPLAAACTHFSPVHTEEGTRGRPALVDPAKQFSKELVRISPPTAALGNRPLFLQPRDVDWGGGWARTVDGGKQLPSPIPTPGAASSNSTSSSTGLKAKSLQPFPWHSFPPASRQRQTRPLVLPSGAHGQDPVLVARSDSCFCLYLRDPAQVA